MDILSMFQGCFMLAFANIRGTEDIKNSDVLVQVQNETFCKTRTEIILCTCKLHGPGRIQHHSRSVNVFVFLTPTNYSF